ncbi:MAG TPA: VWA domain-containing protein [Thermoanaerobaculia bacterium]|nr:VWA domain-containing protein [Thermoanaerobaculia bacterium]
MRRRLLGASLLLALIPSAHAQRVAERIEVTVIEVPVTVADRGGNSVRGLTAENFEVLADGKRVPIEYFEVVDLTKVSATGQQVLPPPAYRNFLLLFDLANSAPTSIAHAQDAATEFVKTQLNERDIAAVATFTAEQGARMVTSFTQDREFLLGAIATLGQANYFKVADPLMLTREPNLTPLTGGGGKRAEDRAARNEALEEEKRDFNAETQKGFNNEMRGRIRTQMKNFGGVARSLDSLRGQKQIILLSEGFDARLLTGRDDLSFKATQEENDASLSGEIWRVDSDTRFGSSSEASEMSEMVSLFRRSDVRMHAIDIKGLRSQVDARDGSKKNNNDSLFIITQPTGGTVFRNTNDLAGQFGQLLRQQEVIYLLGFNAKSGGKPGQFHNLKVKLVNAKGEVTHRAGYYEPSDKASTLETTLKLSEILMTGDDVHDVPLHVTATPVPGGDGKARVPVIVDAAGTGLLQGITGTSASAHVFVYAFDEKKQVKDFNQQRVVLDLPKTGDAVRATGIRYVGSLNLPPGTYDVKALVRVDNTGRIGFSSTRVKVPEYGAAAVMPPVVAVAPGQWVTLVSTTRGAEATDILSLGEQPFVPGTSADIASGTEQNIALMLRGIAVENLAITPMLVAKDGSAQTAPVTLAGRTSPDGHGVVKLLFKLKPETIAKGEYDLKFTVVPLGGLPMVVGLPVVIR